MKFIRTFFTTAWPGLAALTVFCAAGCGSLDVRVSLDAPRRTEWSVLVLPLDERESVREVGDFTLYGWTGAQGASPAISRTVAQAFAAQSAFSTVSEGAARRAFWEKRMTPEDAAQVDPGRACALGRHLKADMAVQGRVLEYRTTWCLFFPYSRVRFSLQGFDPENHRSLWTATAEKGALFRSERELVSELTAEIAARLAEGVGADEK